MRHLVFLFLAFLLGRTALSDSTGISLVSLSPQIFPATTKDPFTRLDWTLSITTAEAPTVINNELALAPDDFPFSHQGFLILQDPNGFEPAQLPFGLNIPEFQDANTNGLYDFFDSATAVTNIKTQGRHATGTGGGADFTATWNRDSGSASGTVVLDFPFFGLKFTHPFSLFQFEGAFTFSRTTNKLNGSVTLTNAAAADQTLTGPLSLTITNNSTLGYTSGTWSDPGGVAYNYSPTDALDLIKSNYISFLFFEDGLPATSDADYLDWFVVVHSRDANTNGVPDLVENASSPTAPSLDIVGTATGIDLTVHGTAGQTYALEQSTDLSAAGWSLAQQIAMNGTAQTVSLPATGGARFFRLKQ